MWTNNISSIHQIQRKQKDRANVENRVSKLKDRISAMTEHTTNVQQERIHSQALCRAVEKQTESGLHFKALSDREKGRLRQEISQQQSELKSLRERKNSKENNIFKATQKIEVLKGQVNMDQQTLDAWLEESARKDEDIMTIVKYAHQDESRIRELTLNIDKQTLEANRKRKALENEATETIMAQVAVEKTAELVQQANVERQELITQWENSIKQMRKKDQDLQQCALLQVETKQMIRERKALLNEKQNFLAYEVDNNKDCEKKIARPTAYGNSSRKRRETALDCKIRHVPIAAKVMSSSLNSLQQEEGVERHRKADLDTQVVSFKAELISQQEKRDRATKQESLKLTKEVRSSKNTEEETFEERDLNQKVLKDCKKTVNKLFLEVMEQHPDLRRRYRCTSCR
ncbi:coiled-coil domain-containing protein 39-like [Hemibagrus wyckioides]|uniref:coiled-coil domain-containing protein 39-like n=1 Tax=Hemibagrus wyckioides TaxID=337641 RepID=UPI00266CFC21|nr:coiled-coil domain-containing protein 39-like [Hemibagrus wyckioides]